VKSLETTNKRFDFLTSINILKESFLASKKRLKGTSLGNIGTASVGQNATPKTKYVFPQ
jgi:hypothetical protein